MSSVASLEQSSPINISTPTRLHSRALESRFYKLGGVVLSAGSSTPVGAPTKPATFCGQALERARHSPLSSFAKHHASQGAVEYFPVSTE